MLVPPMAPTVLASRGAFSGHGPLPRSFSPGGRLEEDEEYITRFIPSFLSTNSTSSTSANLTSLVNSPSSTTTCLLSAPNGQHCLRRQLHLSFLPSRLFCVVGLETTLLSRRPPPRPQS